MSLELDMDGFEENMMELTHAVANTLRPIFVHLLN